MKGYRKVLIIFGGVMLLLFLLNMNHIILLFCNDEIKLSKVNLDNFDFANKAYVFMNPFEYMEDDLTELVYCSGWAFAETSQDNVNKKVTLILKGLKNTFITSECAMLADDIHRREGWKIIPGSNNNFAIWFSTINLPSDIYEIYVYVCENENVHGIASTGQSFKKEGVMLYEYPTGQICENIDIDKITNAIDYGWVTVEVLNECVMVSGWSAVNSICSEDATYYLCFIGNNNNTITLRQPNICRADVADYLDDNIYMMSGFKSGLNKENLPDEKGEVYVVIEYQNSFYLSRPEVYYNSTDI